MIKVTFSFSRFSDKDDYDSTESFSHTFEHDEGEENYHQLHEKFEVFLAAIGYEVQKAEDGDTPDNVVPFS